MSYITVSDLRYFAQDLGFAIPATVTRGQIDTALAQASLYIDSYESKLIGKRAERDQLHAYPRTDLIIHGFEYTVTEIPQIVKRLQAVLTVDVLNGKDLFAEKSALPTIREKVDVLEVTYANPKDIVTNDAENIKGLAWSLLEQLMDYTGKKTEVGFLPVTRT